MKAHSLQVRQHVSPKVRRGGIAVQQYDGVALSHLHVRHLAAEDPPPLLLVWECCRDRSRFSCDRLGRQHKGSFRFELRLALANEEVTDNQDLEVASWCYLRASLRSVRASSKTRFGSRQYELHNVLRVSENGGVIGDNGFSSCLHSLGHEVLRLGIDHS